MRYLIAFLGGCWESTQDWVTYKAIASLGWILGSHHVFTDPLCSYMRGGINSVRLGKCQVLEPKDILTFYHTKFLGPLDVRRP